MDYQTIIDKTYGVINSLKEKNEYKELVSLKKRIDTDLKEVIEKFKKAEEKYLDAAKYGKFHPDLKKIQNEFSKAKAELFSNELVIKYKELEKVMQENINKVTTEIVQSVSNKINNTKTI